MASVSSLVRALGLRGARRRAGEAEQKNRRPPFRLTPAQAVRARAFWCVLRRGSRTLAAAPATALAISSRPSLSLSPHTQAQNPDTDTHRLALGSNPAVRNHPLSGLRVPNRGTCSARIAQL